MDIDFGELGLWDGFGTLVQGEHNYGRSGGRRGRHNPAR
jgi:hypothetical protein